MRRSIVSIALLSAVALAGVAFGATSTVSLTAAGPQPATVTIEWGDTISFTNDDTVPHKVSISRLRLTSPELPPDGRFEHAFAVRAGTYPVRQQGGQLFTGAVVVNVSGKLGLTASRSSVLYRGSVRLTGRSTQPGAAVTIQNRPFGRTGDWTDTRTVQPAADGGFVVTVKQTSGSRYRALAADGQISSQQVSVTVRPIVRIAVSTRRIREGGTLRVVGRVAPVEAARIGTLELYDSRRRAWRKVDDAAAGETGRISLEWKTEPGRWRLRVALRRGSVTSGFEPSASPAVVVTGVAQPRPKQPR